MNRYATEQDVILFEPFLSPNGLKITPGIDYIFDTWTDSKNIATKRIWLTRVEEQLKELVNGSTIWFVASALEDFQAVILSNEYGPSGDIWPQAKEVHFRIIPDAQLKMKRGTQSYASNPFKIHGVMFPKWHFKSVQFPVWDINKPFQRDALPIHIDSDTFFVDNGHAFWLSLPPGGKAEIDGVSAGGGSFTKARFLADKYHGTGAFKITDSYGHDTESETDYWGATTTPPYMAIKGLEVDRLLSVRAGTDGHQVQHLQGSAIGQIYIFNASFRYPKAFQRYQDVGAQLSVDCGINHIKTIFIDGFGSNGLSLYSSAPYTAPDGKPSFVRNPGDGLTIDKAYLYGGHLGVYVHNSASQGIVWTIKELWLGGMTDEYSETTGEVKVDYYLNHAGTDKVIIEKLYHDGSRPRLAKDNSKFQVNEIINLGENFPRPKYKYTHYKFTNWSETIADYHPAINGTRLKCKAGNYYTDRENGFPAVFLKCKKDHIATSTRPKFDTENFEIITWDQKGIPSDDERWSSTDVQRPYPGDNFTHEHDSPLKDFFWMVAKPKVELIDYSFIQNNELFLITKEGKKYKTGTVTEG